MFTHLLLIQRYYNEELICHLRKPSLVRVKGKSFKFMNFFLVSDQEVFCLARDNLEIMFSIGKLLERALAYENPLKIHLKINKLEKKDTVLLKMTNLAPNIWTLNKPRFEPDGVI